jgi:RNA polymerase sigma-70 factor (ECF subfamily)
VPGMAICSKAPNRQVYLMDAPPLTSWSLLEAAASVSAGPAAEEMEGARALAVLKTAKEIRELESAICRLARHTLGSHANLEDISRRIRAQLFARITQPSDGSVPSDWLPAQSVKAVLAHLHRKRRRGNPMATALQANGALVEEQAVKLMPVVEQAITRLPETYRHLFVLADIAGLSMAAVAKILGLGVAMTRSRLGRARLLMDDALTPYIRQGREESR